MFFVEADVDRSKIGKSDYRLKHTGESGTLEDRNGLVDYRLLSMVGFTRDTLHSGGGRSMFKSGRRNHTHGSSRRSTFMYTDMMIYRGKKSGSFGADSPGP